MTQIITLDKIDTKILNELELDSRQSNSNIAKKLKTNKAIVNYRIDRLEKRNIITKYQFISDQTLLNEKSFGLLIQFEKMNLTQETKMIKNIEKIKKIAWVKSTIGTYDLIIVIIAKNIDEFNKTLEKIFEKTDNKISKYDFYIDYEGEIFNHNYLYPDYKIKEKIVKYGSKKIIELKNVELDVLSELKKNPKASILEITSKLNKTYDTVKAKYNFLKEQNILLKCSPKINIELLGYTNWFCLFNIKPNKSAEEEFINFCNNNNNIVRYSKCLGQFNIIINIHAKNSEELKKINYELRSKFSNSINAYELIQLS